MRNIDILIENVVRDVLKEYRYKKSSMPDNSKGLRNSMLGKNPLASDYGNHAREDFLSQVSTVDYNGARFRPEDIILKNPEAMRTYRATKYGNPDMESTLNVFSTKSRSEAEKGLRRAIDTIFGRAREKNVAPRFRITTSTTNLERAMQTSFISGCFWDFSLNNGKTWFKMKPNPTVDPIRMP